MRASCSRSWVKGWDRLDGFGGATSTSAGFQGLRFRASSFIIRIEFGGIRIV